MLPNGAPRFIPNVSVTVTNLVRAMFSEGRLDCKNRAPENRFGNMNRSRPKGSSRKIFGFQNCREERVLIVGDPLGRVEKKAFVDSCKVPNTQPLLFFGMVRSFQALK